MKYENIEKAIFLDRPNRFTAHVDLGGQTETVHVKNTGRLGELLLPGAEVYLSRAANPNRKTKFDLISTEKPGLGTVNIDSQAPNQVMKEWLEAQPFDKVQPEHTWGSSRIDFYMERGREKYLLEVKGCTLAIGGVGYFPDAPTVRGVKHLQELTKASAQGFHAAIGFVIPMPGITDVRPNDRTQPAFGEALRAAEAAGVHVLYFPCQVTPGTLTIDPEKTLKRNPAIGRFLAEAGEEK